MSIKNLSQRGDTIIEVLISMMIIGVVLGAAYATASRSLASSQFAKERTQATKIAESQIEQMKELSDDSLIALGNTYCFDSSYALVDSTSDSTLCVEDGVYEVTITREANASVIPPIPTDTFKISISWIPPGAIGGDSLDGDRANVTLFYSYNIESTTPSTPADVCPAGTDFDGDLITSLTVDQNGDGFIDVIDCDNVVPGPAPISVGNPTSNNITPTSMGITAAVSGNPIDYQGIVIQLLPTSLGAGDPKPGGSPVPVADTDGGNINVTVNNLLPDRQYAIYATADNSIPDSFTTSTIFVTTLPIPPSVLAEVGTPQEYNGNTYYFSNGLYTWSEAKNFAMLSGGYLLTISDQNEVDFVNSIISSALVWTGFNDEDQEGNWVWTNGEPVTSFASSNWHPGEPNNVPDPPGEHGAVMNWVSYGLFNDWGDYSYKTANFVIEFEGP